MTEMRVTLARADFSAGHPKHPIALFDNMIAGEGLGETGPAGAAVEFVEGTEERLAADYIDVNTGAAVVPIFVLKWRFSSIPAGHAILHWRELLAELVAGNAIVIGSIHVRG